MRVAAMLWGRAGARSSSMAESPPQMITGALEGRLACSAMAPWTVAWSNQGASGSLGGRQAGGLHAGRPGRRDRAAALDRLPSRGFRPPLRPGMMANNEGVCPRAGGIGTGEEANGPHVGRRDQGGCDTLGPLSDPAARRRERRPSWRPGPAGSCPNRRSTPPRIRSPRAVRIPDR
jgi:hypothetical protein